MDPWSLIDLVRRRPGTYIGEPTPEKLQLFLGAYRLALVDAGLAGSDWTSFDRFHGWVARRLGFSESTSGWANMILAVELGHEPATMRWAGFDAAASRAQLEAATGRCFILLDEFRDAQ